MSRLRNIVESQLENQYTEQDILGMIDTITPHNIVAERHMDSDKKRMLSKVTLKEANDKVAYSSTELLYRFPSEKSAQLFVESLQNFTKARHKKKDAAPETIEQKREGALYQYEILSNNRVYMTQRDSVTVTPKADTKEMEKKSMASRVFLGTAGGLLTSGLYQTTGNKPNNLVKRKIESVEELRQKAKEIGEFRQKGNKEISVDKLYKDVLFAHAVKNNPVLDKRIFERLERAQNVMPNIQKGLDSGINLISRVFKGYNNNIRQMAKNKELENAPEALLRSRDSLVRKVLNNEPLLTQKKVNNREPEGILAKLKSGVEKFIENVVNIAGGNYEQPMIAGAGGNVESISAKPKTRRSRNKPKPKQSA